MKTKKDATARLRIREKMEEQNHSPQKLSELLDVSVQTVNGWLSKRKGISSKYVEKLEALYDEKLEVLLEEVKPSEKLHFKTSIALQPTSDKVAQVNFLETIAQPVDLKSIRPYLNDEQYEKLNVIYPEGDCFVWGVRDGKGPNFPTKKQYEKLNINDTVLFYQDFRFYAKTRVAFLMESAALSAHLWSDDSTFSNIYFIQEVEAFNLDVVQFNKIVYDKEKRFPVMGFKVLDEEQTQSLYRLLELDSIEDYDFSAEEAEISSIESDEIFREKALELLTKLESNEDLTTESKGQARAEQHLLRALLFGKNKTATCECCKKEYPVSYMKTAHIKKRKYATNEEKLDANIVFALCPMCDIAFENGDLYVEDGFFKVTKKALPKDLDDYLSNFDYTVCPCFNEKNAQYFQWHKDFHLMKIPTK